MRLQRLIFLIRRGTLYGLERTCLEKPKDRDFIETVEGLMFCVVGYLHPPKGYTAYLKYLPSSTGKWSRKRTKYARVIPFYHVSQVEGTYEFLEANYPQYLMRCPVRNIIISYVPNSHVKNYYRPKDRLREVFQNGPQDTLEKKLMDLVTHLSNISGLDINDFGVTGSILTGNHNPEFSDIDLTVHSKEATRRLKSSILEARTGEGDIQAFSDERIANWSSKRTKWFPLNPGELSVIARRRWNYGLYRGIYFSIHPIRTDDEIKERYGDQTYHQRGVISGSAKIDDPSESIYLPAIYDVGNLTIDHEIQPEIEQIVSFEGVFCDIFRKNELVEFKGTLEAVTGKRDFSRIVIGGSLSTGDYMKLVRDVS
jgi:predicted nucleotidyltransferase